MDDRLAFAIETACAAGKATLEWFQRGVTVERKADDSPVTVADRTAERVIREAIERRYPGEAILGEEEGSTGEGLSRWVIDPIDGTKSFVCGVPLFATLLSYESDGIPVIGVACFPALGDTMWAFKGGGAFWNGNPCQVSTTSDLSRASIATGSLTSTCEYGRLEGLLKLAEAGPVLRTWGDAYGHMLVATGRVEAMIDPVVAYWDISAVSLIVEQAGGCFTDFQGRSGLHGEAISANPAIQAQILEAFAAPLSPMNGGERGRG
ncbi:MAG: hypothetical protein K1X67_06760 [Fimbriimonadaceae bacterium]|nr:hypothetical protein [Fimbriimonadaceae bacterium]